MGITADMLDRVDALHKSGVDIICLDSAHGHTRGVIEMLKKVKKNFKDLPVIAGNVGTGIGAKALADAGADAIKVGIGQAQFVQRELLQAQVFHRLLQ